jgi:beta-glucanase (GH16 family)
MSEVSHACWHDKPECVAHQGLLDQRNTVEVVWQGDRAAQIVNGRTVNVATRLQQPDPQNPGQFIPLTRGKIAIEIEYAQVWFRRIEVKAI